MKYISLFSGIEAATQAWHPLGWSPLWFSEVDPFANAVLQHRYPEVTNRGDITQHSAWPAARPDLVVGGSPCQGFSIAGLRRGLDDARSNLMLEFLRVVDRYRPRWILWENVPGALSTNGGRDFGALLGGLAELGYGFAYRVFDAQYVRTQRLPRAVPQSRRRVFVVGHSGGLWQRAAAVLLEPEGLCGDSPTRRETGQGIACGVAHSVTTHSTRGISNSDYIPEIAEPILCRDNKGISSDGVNIVAENHCTLDSRGATHARIMVRRLTPRECERLQGFPDDWTRIPWRNKSADKCPDGPRYRCLGNSMAVNVMDWLGRRIAFVDTIEKPEI